VPRSRLAVVGLGAGGGGGVFGNGAVSVDVASLVVAASRIVVKIRSIRVAVVTLLVYICAPFGVQRMLPLRSRMSNASGAMEVNRASSWAKALPRGTTASFPLKRQKIISGYIAS